MADVAKGSAFSGYARDSNFLEYVRGVRWSLRRWTAKQIWRRLRLKTRRSRWSKKRHQHTMPFVKNANASATAGPAVVFGDFSGNHGLGRAAVYDMELLKSKHSLIQKVDIGPYLSGQTVEPILVDPKVENAYFFCQPDTYDVICNFLRPGNLANTWRVGRLVWETPIFPDSWKFIDSFLHEIWAPSQFCADIFRDALNSPVSLIPYPVPRPNKVDIDMRRKLNIGHDVFLGLTVMDLVSCPERKNPWAHVRAWKRAFPNNPKAVLVMKLRVGKHTRIVLNELQELLGTDSNVIFLTDECTAEELAALQWTADIYLSLHRSEGFGLTIYEALLLGKPVVATDWSGNACYGREFPNYVPVPYRLVQYRDWLGHYEDRHFKWADPMPGSILKDLGNRFSRNV